MASGRTDYTMRNRLVVLVESSPLVKDLEIVCSEQRTASLSRHLFAFSLQMGRMQPHTDTATQA